MEFSSIFNGLGVNTTLCYRRDKILRGFDDEIRKHIGNALIGRGIDIRFNCMPQAITQSANGYRVLFDDGNERNFDLVLAATGRKPATDDLNLPVAGVKTGTAGEVVVDRFSKSSNNNIYAVGDATNRIALTPVAIREASAFVETVFNRNPKAVDYRVVPSAVFSSPEIGVVGISQEQALADFEMVDIYRSLFMPMAYAFSGRDERMLIKLIVDGKTDRIIACHIAGGDAAEITQLIAVAINAGATKQDFDQTIALHPSAAEELVLMSSPSERYIQGQLVSTPS